MIKKIVLVTLCLLNTSMIIARQNFEPVRVIFDTDMGPDYDDVGAMAMLHAYADSGEAKILATIASTKYEGIAAVLNVLNTYFHKPYIPIGVPKGDALTLKDSQHWSDTLIANYPHHIRNNSEVPDAVTLYRKVLSEQADNSVTIITVGFLTNIAALLQSPPDGFSPLSGKDLVNKKVKQLVSMAGKFPSGLEFNIEEDAKAAKFAYENLDIPVLFSGFEIGSKIKTGIPLIQNTKIQNSPVKDVYRISIPKAKMDKNGRMSWDQTAVLVAIKGHEPYYNLKSGSIEVNEDGSNSWNDKGTTQHHYLIENRSAAEVQELVNKLMMHQPVSQDKPLVVFVVGDHEYSSELTMPMIAEELENKYHIRTKVLKSFPDHTSEENIPGLDALENADLAVFFLRWRRLPANQVKYIEAYLKSGKPVIGFRTSTHAFNYPEGHELEKWNAFGEFAFNAPPGWEKAGHTHYGHESTTEVAVIPEAAQHPILRGVDKQFPGKSWLYTVLPDFPSEGSEWLLMGKAVNPDDPAAIDHPVAWTGRNSYGGKIFMTTLGHPEDFREEAFQRLVINAFHWILNKPISDKFERMDINVAYDQHEANE